MKARRVAAGGHDGRRAGARAGSRADRGTLAAAKDGAEDGAPHGRAADLGRAFLAGRVAVADIVSVEIGIREPSASTSVLNRIPSRARSLNLPPRSPRRPNRVRGNRRESPPCRARGHPGSRGLRPGPRCARVRSLSTFRIAVRSPNQPGPRALRMSFVGPPAPAASPGRYAPRVWASAGGAPVQRRRRQGALGRG